MSVSALFVGLSLERARGRAGASAPPPLPPEIWRVLFRMFASHSDSFSFAHSLFLALTLSSLRAKDVSLRKHEHFISIFRLFFPP